MLFPAVDTHVARIIIGLALGLLVTAVAILLIGLNQAGTPSAMAATATATKTPTKPATATPTPSPTPTQTSTPTSTNTPSPTPTPTETSTATTTPPPTATLLPPPPTALPVLADTLVISQTEIVEIATQPPISFTAPLTQNTTLTGTQVITPIGTPTPTPTPVPRTVQVATDISNYTQAKEHYWFTRAFTKANVTWGSFYYPYGTNARGKYFWHYGIDIQNPENTPIVAAGDGVVIYAGPDSQKLLGPWLDFFGQAVVIEHTQPWNGMPVYTLYGHVSKALVQVGQQVKTGDPIALVGQLGVALGPHLHFEVRVGAGTYYNTRNPDLWIRPDPGYGVIAGRVVDHQNYYVPQQLVTLHFAENPGKFWRQTFTYPDEEVNSDEFYGETFSFSDVPSGRYLLKTFFDGRQLTVPITVTNQSTTFVLLKQELPPPPPKTPAPPPTATAATPAPVNEAVPPAGESQSLPGQ